MYNNHYIPKVRIQSPMDYSTYPWWNIPMSSTPFYQLALAHYYGVLGDQVAGLWSQHIHASHDGWLPGNNAGLIADILDETNSTHTNWRLAKGGGC
mmetsp:Transcript_51034/g.61470  ORF Transcript_51034/g.61470 Transcript_51034/m.61470 type:complete len:96 (-) Transcript_51034:552-839(-)